MYGPYQVYLGGGVNPPHAPVIPREWFCPEYRYLGVVAEVDEKAMREILSYTPFKYVNNRARFIITYLKGHTLTTPNGYFEAGISVAVRYKDYLSSHFIYMYCDNATAILAGREVFGMPKKDALIHLWEESDHKWGRVVREDVRLFEIDFTADRKAPDVQLVEGEKVVGSLHVRRLPLIDRPGDAYWDIPYRDIKENVKERVSGHAKLSVGELKWDPIYDLKPKALGGFFGVSSFGGYLYEETRKILDSYVFSPDPLSKRA